MANEKNLIPQNMRTKAEQREIARKGGKASGQARAEKKLASQLYTELLADKYDIIIDGSKKNISGNEFFKKTALKILMRGDSASVSLMKEIRESIEGSKVNVNNLTRINPEDIIKNHLDKIKKKNESD